MVLCDKKWKFQFLDDLETEHCQCTLTGSLCKKQYLTLPSCKTWMYRVKMHFVTHRKLFVDIPFLLTQLREYSSKFSPFCVSKYVRCIKIFRFFLYFLYQIFWYTLVIFSIERCHQNPIIYHHQLIFSILKYFQ